MRTNLRILFALLTCISISNIINAQMKVSSYGNFSIATNPIPNLNSKVGILFSANTSLEQTYYGLNSNINSFSSNYCRGLQGTSYRSTLLNDSRAYGVYGYAGNATSGYNYGVYGKVAGSGNGAGIFGAAVGMGDYNVGGNYAGFFYGTTKVLGVIYADNLLYNSDLRLKKNIIPINNLFEKIYELNAMEFQYKTIKELEVEGLIPMSDTTKSDYPERLFIDKIRYGYIAQEVREIFPELVYEGEDGFLSLDYVGLMPLMLEAIKKQNEAISELNQQISICCNKSKNINQTDVGNSQLKSIPTSAILYQNKPNPFSQNTNIKCFIPKESKVAEMYIYDMQGIQIKKIQIIEKEIVNILINGFELKAGMYMYTLIVDGNEIDTKKMILTN